MLDIKPTVLKQVARLLTAIVAVGINRSAAQSCNSRKCELFRSCKNSKL